MSTFAYLGRRLIRNVVRSAPNMRGRGRMIAATRNILHPRTGKILTETQPGIWMELDLNSCVERDLYYFGAYRPNITNYFRSILSPGMTVVDIGANVGSYSLVASQQVGPAGRVVSFEPDPVVFSRLQTNVSLNDAKNIRTSNVAISDQVGDLTFFQNADDDDNRAQGSLARESHHQKSFLVRCTTLSQILEKLAISPVDVIKIDTQGAEVRVFKGAKDLVERCRPTLLWRCHRDKCMQLGDNPAEIIEELLRRNYRVSEFSGRHQRTPVPVLHPVEREDGTFVAYPR